MNKKISFPISLTIIIVLSVLVVILLLIMNSTGGRNIDYDYGSVSAFLLIRSQAELIKGSEGSYENLSCTSQKEMQEYCEIIKSEDGNQPIIFASKDKYCVYGELKSGKNKGYYICISDTGVITKTKIFPGESGYCDGITFECPDK